jgi:hypothetical protein
MVWTCPCVYRQLCYTISYRWMREKWSTWATRSVVPKRGHAQDAALGAQYTRRACMDLPGACMQGGRSIRRMRHACHWAGLLIIRTGRTCQRTRTVFMRTGTACMRAAISCKRTGSACRRVRNVIKRKGTGCMRLADTCMRTVWTGVRMRITCSKVLSKRQERSVKSECRKDVFNNGTH